MMQVYRFGLEDPCDTIEIDLFKDTSLLYLKYAIFFQNDRTKYIRPHIFASVIAILTILVSKCTFLGQGIQ